MKSVELTRFPPNVGNCGGIRVGELLWRVEQIAKEFSTSTGIYVRARRNRWRDCVELLTRRTLFKGGEPLARIEAKYDHEKGGGVAVVTLLPLFPKDKNHHLFFKFPGIEVKFEEKAL